MKRLEKKQSEYPWMVIICCFLMVCIGLGFCSSSKQLFFKAVTEAQNIDRLAYSFNTTFRYAAMAVMNLFFGTLVHKFKPRLLIAFGFICLIESTLLYALATNIILIYAGGVLLGVGMCFTANTMASYIINARCKKNTGTILGFVMASNGLGGAAATQILGYLIRKHPMGYRDAYYLVAIILAVVGTFVVVCFKDDKNVIPAPAKKNKKARGQSWVGISYAEGKKKPYFLPVCVCLFLTGFVLSGINGISITHAKDVCPEDKYAFIDNIWTFHSLALMCAKFFVGFLYDRKGLRTCLLICQVTSMVVLSALALVNPSPFGMAMWVIYAIFSSLALPLETIGVSLVVGDVFGNQEFGKYLGLMSALNSVGFAVGDPLMNLVYKVFGSYTIAIWIAVGAFAVVTVAFQFILTSAHKDREKILAQLEQQNEPV